MPRKPAKTRRTPRVPIDLSPLHFLARFLSWAVAARLGRSRAAWERVWHPPLFPPPLAAAWPDHPWPSAAPENRRPGRRGKAVRPRAPMPSQKLRRHLKREIAPIIAAARRDVPHLDEAHRGLEAVAA